MKILQELINDIEDALDKTGTYHSSVEMNKLIIETNKALIALKMLQEMMELNVPVTCGKKP